MKTTVALPERRPLAAVLSIALASAGLMLAGCAEVPEEAAAQRPLYAQPTPRPANIERINSGGLYQPGMKADLFAGRASPRRIGDTLKVDISESLSASNSVKTDTSRDSTVASKGPGTSESGIGILKGILNLNASASGSDAYKGTGSAENTSSFTGQIAAVVVNVLPNGNLLVAGEHSVWMKSGMSVLRFSGIVDPKDLKYGNVVASADVVNARFELGGQGDVPDASSRSWMQRVLTNTLRVW